MNEPQRVDKKEVAAALAKAGLIGKDFTGKLTINFGQGGINDIEKYEKIK